MKKTRLLALVCALLLLAGCASPAAPNPSGASASEESGVPASGDVNRDGDVAMVEDPDGFPDYAPYIEGAVRFEEDASRQASVDFPADGTERVLSLEDGNGLVWVLTIPPDALDHPETITMTAMTSISSGLGEIAGGVVLQPDGLHFLRPATLHVKGAGIEKSGLLFSGTGQGEKLELSIVQRGQDALEMQLFHFSTAYATNSDAVIAKFAQEAQGQIKKLSALAKQMRSKPIETPVPPPIQIKCHHDTEGQDNAILEKYLATFRKPEIDLISALAAAKRNLALTSTQSPGFDVELQLMSRLLEKVNALIAQYKNQEEMFLAVASAAIYTERTLALLGESLGEGQSFLPVLAEWAKHITEKHLDELVKRHEYKNIHPILKMARYAALLGADINDFMERLGQALTFHLETTNTVKIGDAPSTATYVVESDIEILALRVSQTGMIGGNGTGTYKSFEVPLMEDTEVKLELQQLGTSFDIAAAIWGFNPCQSDTITVFVDRFGAESETLTSSGPDIPSSSRERPVVQGTCEKGFSDRKKGDMGFYGFELTLRNGQKVAAEQTFTASGKGMDIEYQVKLTHTP